MTTEQSSCPDSTRPAEHDVIARAIAGPYIARAFGKRERRPGEPYNPDLIGPATRHAVEDAHRDADAVRAALAAAGYAVVRLPELDTALAHLVVVDVAAEARRMFGEEAAAIIAGRPLPQHDYRLHMETPTGRVTFSRGGTAEEVMAWMAREAAQSGGRR